MTGLAESLRTWLSRVTGLAPLKVDSAAYWEQRYRAGRTSGAGSYGRLARFKADFLNGFVADNNISSIIEFGSGDGAQLELAEYPAYVGVDVAETAVRHCRAKFAKNPNFEFYSVAEFDAATTAELTLSLDVIYHLVEDWVFEDYMQRLFDASRKYVIIYSSNYQDEADPSHVRRRCFTDWVLKHRSDFDLTSVVANKYPFDPSDPSNTSKADFYIYVRN